MHVYVKNCFCVVMNTIPVFRCPLQWSTTAGSCRKRRKYVQLYATCSHRSFKVDNQEIRDMERDVDVEVILLWRLAILLAFLKL